MWLKVFIFDIVKEKFTTSTVNHSKECTCIHAIKDADGYLIASGSDDGVLVLMHYKPSTSELDIRSVKNIADRAIIGIHLSSTYAILTMYNDNSVFVNHF